MAEEKKEAPKRDMTTEMIALLVGLFFLSLVVERVYTYWAYVQYRQSDIWWMNVAQFTADILWPVWKGVALLIILASVAVIVHAYIKLSAINREEQEIYGSEVRVETNGEVTEPKNEKWESILEKVNSTNVADWRVAIIEADIMLEDLLRRAGYHGDTIGEMLKSVDKSDMLTIESAWSAHKVRNDIAHKPDYNLNEREAKRTIAQFEEVFKEFNII